MVKLGALVVKGIPLAYSKDLQEDKEAVFDAEETLNRSIQVTASVVVGLALNPQRTESAAGGLALATDVADLLVARGVPFREAHEVVGCMVRDLVSRQQDFSSLTRREWREYHHQLDAVAAEQITAAGSVAARCTPQSTAPSAVAEAIAEVRQWVTDLALTDELAED